MAVIRVQKGGVQAVRFEFREVRADSLDGQRIQPNGCSVTVLNPDGTTQLSNATAAWERAGTFVLYWDTSSLALGDYRCRVRFGQAFSTAQGGATNVGERAIILRLVATL